MFVCAAVCVYVWWGLTKEIHRRWEKKYFVNWILGGRKIVYDDEIKLVNFSLIFFSLLIISRAECIFFMSMRLCHTKNIINNNNKCSFSRLLDITSRLEKCLLLTHLHHRFFIARLIKWEKHVMNVNKKNVIFTISWQIIINFLFILVKQNIFF